MMCLQWAHWWSTKLAPSMQKPWDARPTLVLGVVRKAILAQVVEGDTVELVEMVPLMVRDLWEEWPMGVRP